MDTIIKQLLNPEVFNHPVNTLDVKETHISWVILTGDFAYKIKKNIVYDFIDYSNIALRKKYCHDELRLNRKLAKDIYLKVVPIVKTKQGLKIESQEKGEIIEWAIQFSKEAIVTTNFRPYESAILHAGTEVEKETKVIWCDTGYNTIETYKHAEELIETLDLNILLYVFALSVLSFD